MFIFCLAVLVLAGGWSQTLHTLAAQTPLFHAEYDQLSSRLAGRLYAGSPFARPCFTFYNGISQAIDVSACSSIRENYLDEPTRSSAFGAYINTQWETCQTSDQQCLLDSSNLNSTAPTEGSNSCNSGSVAPFYIDVREPKDVIAMFKFAENYKMPVYIKNTGHDYKGRSSAPHALGLWTHNLKNISYNVAFVPEGCVNAGNSPAVTAGAGVQFMDAYAFAEANNITIAGGTDRTVGMVGGWAQGGGHSLLSNTMGLGADRALEYKIVTPDGVYRTANECQNPDLFWALRGGGGGTYGVVMEGTFRVTPQVPIQAVIVSFSDYNITTTNSLWSVMAENALQWAEEGWGYISDAQAAIFVNPNMTTFDAEASMAPVLSFARQIQAENVTAVKTVVQEFPSYSAFFDLFAVSFPAIVGTNLALASRLIAKTNFMSDSSLKSLVSALVTAEETTPGVIVLATAPASYRGKPNATSVTPAWYESLYHVTLVTQWSWNAATAEKIQSYQLASKSIDNLRKITPDAAYQNEADVYEPNHEESFWGGNYDALLNIKKKYDPSNILQVWHGIGYNPNSTHFSCYLHV